MFERGAITSEQFLLAAIHIYENPTYDACFKYILKDDDVRNSFLNTVNREIFVVKKSSSDRPADED